MKNSPLSAQSKFVNTAIVCSMGLILLCASSTPSFAQQPKDEIKRLCRCSCSYRDDSGKLHAGWTNDFNSDDCGKYTNTTASGISPCKGDDGTISNGSYQRSQCADITSSSAMEDARPPAGTTGTGVIEQPPRVEDPRRIVNPGYVR